MRRREAIGWFTLVMTFALSPTLPGAAAELQGAQMGGARLEAGPTRIDWLPQADDEQWILTVTGPGDLYIRREFKGGQAPFLSLFDSKGDRLPDGTYTWELRGVPKPGALPREELLKSGHFFVREGSFVAAPVDTAARPPKAPHPDITAKNFVETGTLVVQNNACIGNQCGTSDANFSALKLKSTLPNILFDDVDVPCESPPCTSTAHDWALLVNPSDVAQFSLRDVDGGLNPFTVAAGAPDNSLYVSGNGNVGLGTATPVAQLHIRGTDSGFRNSILVENAGSQNFREMLELRNNGGVTFIMEDTSVPQRWAQGTGGTIFVIDEQAHAGTEFTLTNTGNLTIAGVLTQGSSRELKTALASLEPRDVLARVSALPVSLWSYKTETTVRHVGPMAEDFHQAFGLGEDDKHIAPGDQAGVALLAVQGLNEILQNKAKEIATLQDENADLAKRIATLEALLATLMDKKAASAQAEPAP
jgi:endosialidase-like protein